MRTIFLILVALRSGISFRVDLHEDAACRDGALVSSASRSSESDVSEGATCVVRTGTKATRTLLQASTSTAKAVKDAARSETEATGPVRSGEDLSDPVASPQGKLASPGSRTTAVALAASQTLETGGFFRRLKQQFGVARIHTTATILIVLLCVVSVVVLMGLAWWRVIGHEHEDSGKVPRSSLAGRFSRGSSHQDMSLSSPLSAQLLRPSARPSTARPSTELLVREGSIRSLGVVPEIPMVSLTHITREWSESRGPSATHFKTNLAPGLVVPPDNECFLAVPTLSALGLPQCENATFNVVDLKGQPVVRARVSKPDWVAGAAPGAQIIVLRAATGASELLAYCESGRSYGKSVQIFGAHGELFGTIAKDPDKPRYVMTGSPHQSFMLSFEGNFAFATITVMDEQRQQRIASTEPCRVLDNARGTYYVLRSMPSVDVGAMLCGLLAIDQMESS